MAVLVATALFLPAGPVTATPAPSADDGGGAPRTTFVLGIKQDIDSLNPFVGLTISAFEAYQLMYD
ncbi:hypothetical protein, partial [Escherichia coli]|uniref:hypothetical protein n=1 Tax=Escherichia coli TaxID=562 RepID=UPI001AA1CAB2